ncbi:DUF4126 domain-containing protein [Fibrella forsythiae]|uniref:DUF4126 domain-containing protein n=1 Tax=Fibrella forsythiae TaxID=2817061 RepID=A0ABS3JIJ1_9BACT|nr:DUF4126 domain-containing protein [Fibrella forsythiae]MBO0949823.1 DUF4126 domain-containing protein [Fibrella forsythiae]
MNTSYLRSFQIGFIAGMRAMSAPALLSHRLSQTIPVEHPQTLLHYLAQPTTARVFKALAGGEIVGDKLPSAPNRTSPPQFLGRIVMGSTCGAVVSEVEGQQVPVGAILGGLGAVAGTLLFFNLRRWLDHDLGLPDTIGALVEDALVAGGGLAVVNGINPVARLA